MIIAVWRGSRNAMFRATRSHGLLGANLLEAVLMLSMLRPHCQIAVSLYV